MWIGTQILNSKFAYGPELLYKDCAKMEWGAFRTLQPPMPSEHNIFKDPADGPRRQSLMGRAVWSEFMAGHNGRPFFFLSDVEQRRASDFGPSAFLRLSALRFRAFAAARRPSAPRRLPLRASRSRSSASSSPIRRWAR